MVADLMLANARSNDCTDIDTYRKEMEQLVSSATEQLDLSKVVCLIVIVPKMV